MLETDASDGVIAGVLYQRQSDGEWHPVAYYSKTMIDAELNYPIHDKEMLAIVSSFQHWHVYLEGTPDTVHVFRLAGPDCNFRSRLDWTEKFRSGLRFLGPDCKMVPII